LCAGLVAVSCGREAPTAPAQSNDLLGGILSTASKTVGSLLQCKKLPAYANAQVIGRAGGTLQVGPHTLTVPKGALSSDVLISGYAPSDNNRTVQFQPEGLQFAKPASLTMSYSGCSLVVGLLPRVAHVDDNLTILDYLLSTNNIFARTVTGQVPHFSGYATAW
jgi:hypothetical protein